MKPIYFNVVVWGEEFRNHFVDYCIPSLLSQNNLPALSLGRENKFVICTTRPDWDAMRETASFQVMEKYVEPVLIEIPYPEPGQSAPMHMGIGHKPATEMMFRDKVYGCMITPDLVLSDGSLATIERLAQEGIRLVIATSLRVVEEEFLPGLRDGGFAPKDALLSETGAPLTISSRQLVDLNLRTMHSETRAWEWDAPYFSYFPVGAWWRVPEGRGILFYTLSWAPVLVDYAGIESHDASMMETWPIDGNYLDRNFKDYGEVHAIQDSDDFAIVSWGPAADKLTSLVPDRVKSSPRHGEVIKGLTIRRTFLDPRFDAFKRAWFFKPVRLHAGDLNARWDETEQRTRRLVEKYTASLSLAVVFNLMGWWIRLLLAALPAKDFYVALGLWIAIRLYRPLINSDIRLSQVYENRADYLSRLRRRLAGGR